MKFSSLLRNWRWVIVTVCLTVSLGLAVVGGRLFPFSDYPMFAYLRKDLGALALACDSPGQGRRLLDTSVIWPLNRRHLSEFLRVSLQKGEFDSEWVRRTWQRIHNQKIPCERLVALRIFMAPIAEAQVVLDPERTQVLREIPAP